MLVDDESLVRDALSRALTDGQIDVVGDAFTGHDAIALVDHVRPDVVLLDLMVPGGPGMDTISKLRAVAPSSRVLVLTREEHNRVVEAIVAGASGYILKTCSPEEIIAAVRATAAGEAVLSPRIAGRLLARIRQREIPVTASSEDAASTIRAVLTVRELQIFEQLATGRSNQQIGRELSLSPNTVSNHIASILEKLHLDNRIQAAVQAVRAGLA